MANESDQAFGASAYAAPFVEPRPVGPLIIPEPYMPYVAPGLTEEAVRRIIKEELEKLEQRLRRRGRRK